MSKQVSFDFRQINSLNDFYDQFAQQFSLPDGYRQLNASGNHVPQGIKIIAKQRIKFADVIDVMNDAQDMWEEEFVFALDITKSSN